MIWDLGSNRRSLTDSIELIGEAWSWRLSRQTGCGLIVIGIPLRFEVLGLVLLRPVMLPFEACLEACLEAPKHLEMLLRLA